MSFASQGHPEMKSFLTSVWGTSSWSLSITVFLTPSVPLNFIIMVVTVGVDLEQTTSFAREQLGTIFITLLIGECLINIYWRASWSSWRSCSYSAPLSVGYQAPPRAMEEARGASSGWRGPGGPSDATGWLCFVKAAARQRKNEQCSREQPSSPCCILYPRSESISFHTQWLSVACVVDAVLFLHEELPKYRVLFYVSHETSIYLNKKVFLPNATWRVFPSEYSSSFPQNSGYS